jgi:hypothetical protein
MRLLDTATLLLSEFFGDLIPQYVALSHTWVTNQEISLQDLQEIHKHPRELSPHPFTLRSGYQKIVECCKQARDNGFEWAWIDTCCIDKTSSAELSEAINSMFQWYRNCQICYTFLSDVSDGDFLDNLDSEFRNSRWFTRGWTLQELLAPPDLRFFSRSWNILGDRCHLRDLISEVTGIPARFLGPANVVPQPSSTSLQNRRPDSFFEASIAQRMSWASRRNTTRKEDLSYCLLGIFNANIPLLYGEGDKAFRRLQEEIIKQTNDQSLFAWGYKPYPDPENATEPSRPSSYLAISPVDFKYCNNMVTYNTRRQARSRTFEVTKKGLCIDVDILMLGRQPYYNPYPGILAFGLLDCSTEGGIFNRVAIPLSQLSREGEDLLVTRKHASPRLWANHLSRRALSMTVHITDSLPNFTNADEEDSEERGVISALLQCSLIIPPIPFMSIERLIVDPTLAITIPEGANWFCIQEADASAPTLASGRAYFRLRPTNINISSAYPDSLIMIAFQLQPPENINTSPDLLQNETVHNEPHHDHYQARPSKLRKENRISSGWPYTRYCSLHKKKLHGKIHCFMVKTPAVSEGRLRTPECLEALPWADIAGLSHTDQNFRLEILKAKVMRSGSWRNVLTLTSTLDDSHFVGFWNSLIKYRLLFPTHIPQIWNRLSLSLLGFLSILASSLCLGHKKWFTASLWMVMGISYVTIGLNRHHSDREVPLVFLIGFFLILSFFMALSSIGNV